MAKEHTIQAVDAQKVLKEIVNNPALTFINITFNELGGVTLIYQDINNRQFPVRFNRQGFFDIISSGLEAIAKAKI
jgi:hypothetical protein